MILQYFCTFVCVAMRVYVVEVDKLVIVSVGVCTSHDLTVYVAIQFLSIKMLINPMHSINL